MQQPGIIEQLMTFPFKTFREEYVARMKQHYEERGRNDVVQLLEKWVQSREYKVWAGLDNVKSHQKRGRRYFAE